MTLKSKIIRIVGYLVLGIILAAFLYTVLFYEDLKSQMEHEIQLYGAIGCALGGFLVDTIGGPLGPEVPVIGGLLAGIKVQTVLYMVSLGSTVASLLVYWIGYAFGTFGAREFISDEKFDHWKRLFIRHRRITLVLGALTPVPYVTVCALAGIFKVRLWEFLIFSIAARLLRVALVAYVVLLFQGIL